MSGPQAATEVVAWAAGLIREARAEWGRPLARYGSPAWAAMPPRQRWAAVLLAAECWRSEGTPEAIAERFAYELYANQLAAKKIEDEDYLVAIDDHRQHWRYLRGRAAPTEWRADVDEPTDGAA